MRSVKRCATAAVLMGLGLALAWAGDGGPQVADPARAGKERTGDPKVARPKTDVRKQTLDKAGTAEPKRPSVSGEVRQLAAVCALTADQQNKVAALAAARQKAIDEAMAKFQADLALVLTPEQKAAWNESVLLTTVQRAFAKAALTEAQLTQVKTLIAAQGANQVLLPDGKSGSESVKGLLDAVMKDVLTDEQRAGLRAGKGADAPAPARTGKDPQPAAVPATP
jgi:Spy/CpxP family protein refolding chaperone